MDDQDQEESFGFYRDEHIFENQVRPIEECDDPQPYLYVGDFTDAEVHSFSDDKFRAEEFKKSLLCLPAETQEEPYSFLLSFLAFTIWMLKKVQQQIC